MSCTTRVVAALIAALPLLSGVAPRAFAADDYPSRPIHLVIPYPPGGSADLIGRMLADKVGKQLNQSVIVENRGGASGAIGSEYVARADPDGYTLLVAISDTHAINPAVFKRLPYDPQKDFTPISLLAVQPFVLVVGPRVEAKTLSEFVAAAKAKPGSMSFASNGAGGVQHLAMELFSSAAGIQALHVPYKGAAPALSDVMGGHVDATFISLQGAGSNLKSGQLRALAITSAKRLAVAPDIPTFAESGYPSFTVQQWYGLVGPKGLPSVIVDKLNQNVQTAMKSPDIADKLVPVGTEPASGTAEAFKAFLASEVVRWADVAHKSKISIQ